jgi:hypothetical protein
MNEKGQVNKVILLVIYTKGQMMGNRLGVPYRKDQEGYRGEPGDTI